MRTKEFGETDLFVTFLTHDRGRLRGIAKGARRSRKRFVNCLNVFCLAELDYSLKREGGLYFLNSGKLIDAYAGLRTDYAILSRASYMVELTEILFPWGVADRKMFDLLRWSLDALAKGERTDVISMIFEIKAMSVGGYAINLDRCSFCGRPYKGEGRAVFKPEKGGIACLKCQQESAVSPGLNPQSVKMMKLMETTPLNALMQVEFSANVTKKIKSVLKLHREYHLGQRPKTANYLE